MAGEGVLRWKCKPVVAELRCVKDWGVSQLGGVGYLGWSWRAFSV